MNEKGGPPHRSVCTLFAQGRARKWPALARQLRAGRVSVNKMETQNRLAQAVFRVWVFCNILCYDLTPGVVCAKSIENFRVIYFPRPTMRLYRAVGNFQSLQKTSTLEPTFCIYSAESKKYAQKIREILGGKLRDRKFTYKFSQKPPGAGAFILSFSVCVQWSSYSPCLEQDHSPPLLLMVPLHKNKTAKIRPNRFQI